MSPVDQEPYEGQCPYVLGMSRRSNTGHSKRIGNMHICELPAAHYGNHLCPVCGLSWAYYVQDALPGLQEAPHGPPAA